MKKRANGEGTIYKRKDGRWAASVSLERGRRKALYGKTRQEVAGKMTATQKAKLDGLPIPSERQTVGQFLSEWLESIRTSIRPMTWERYESLIRLHVVPEIGRVPLAGLTPARLQKMFADLLESGLSPASVRQARAIVRKALNDATRWGYVARNVAALTSAPRVQRQEMQTLSPEQARLLIEGASGGPFEALYVLAITTGMRQGEILGLRWKDVDLDASQLHVHTALHRTRDGFEFSEPKTAKSRRKIILTKTAVASLRRHRVMQTEQRLQLGAYWQNHDLVFSNDLGGPIDAGNLRNRSFWPLLKRAGLPRIRFHDLRHTAATLMLGRDVHPKVVSEMLGHSQIGITLDLYSHVTPTMQRQAAEEMEALLANA